jgi:hypothetical protein
LQQPTDHRGRRLSFADGTTAAVYRETSIRRLDPDDPVVLIVGFQLRLVRGPLAHAAFRTESLFNTMLFAGFPGFVSKLWLRHDDNGRYRGFYQWDGADEAEHYAGCLRRVLRLVCDPGSVQHRVLPGLVRDEVLRPPDQVSVTGDPLSGSSPSEWWRLIDVQPPL